MNNCNKNDKKKKWILNFIFKYFHIKKNITFTFTLCVIFKIYYAINVSLMYIFRQLKVQDE